MKFLKVWIQEQTISSSFLVLDNSKLVPTYPIKHSARVCPVILNTTILMTSLDRISVSKLKGIDFLTFSFYTISLYVLSYVKCKHILKMLRPNVKIRILYTDIVYITEYETINFSKTHSSKIMLNEDHFLFAPWKSIWSGRKIAHWVGKVPFVWGGGVTHHFITCAGDLTGLMVPKLRSCLVEHLKHIFSVFKQHYTYFHTLFHPHVFKKNTNNITQTPLSNG